MSPTKMRMMYSITLFLLQNCFAINLLHTPEIDTSLLHKHVIKLSVDLCPRDYQHMNNLNASADYIREEFESMGLFVFEQLFTVEDSLYRNILTHFGPDSGPQIIVGAHYDSADSLPGADDNASGVAGLIELARLLKDTPLRKGITLVGYTLEEPPFFGTMGMGSFMHAKAEHDLNTDIELMISLEMIGYFSDEPKSQHFPLKLMELIYPTTGNFIMVVDRMFSSAGKKLQKSMSQYTLLPIRRLTAPKSLGGVDFSDHRNFWHFGYDAVMITNTAFYRNLAYHTINDTHDRLDYKRMADVVRSLYGAIIEN